MMWFYWFMLICDLLIPLAMVIGGYIIWKHTPKTINGLMGYRTSRSMKNADTWKFANEYCGRLWWKTGWVIMLPSIVMQIFLYGASDDMICLVGTVWATVQTVILIVLIYPVEKALKKSFNDDGSRR